MKASAKFHKECVMCLNYKLHCCLITVERNIVSLNSDFKIWMQFVGLWCCAFVFLKNPSAVIV